MRLWRPRPSKVARCSGWMTQERSDGAAPQISSWCTAIPSPIPPHSGAFGSYSSAVALSNSCATVAAIGPRGAAPRTRRAALPLALVLLVQRFLQQFRGATDVAVHLFPVGVGFEHAALALRDVEPCQGEALVERDTGRGGIALHSGQEQPG